MQLYPEKQYELAQGQVPQASQYLGDSLTKLVDAQIDNEVRSTHSTSVLNNLITSIKEAVVPGKLNPSTSDGAQVAAEVGVTAARTFSHSLLHIIDDGLVWMDATQVSSAARSTFNMDSFQRSCASLLSGVKRNTQGQFQFGTFWNGLNRVQQVGFVRSLIQLYDSNQTQRNSKVCPNGTQTINPTGLGFDQAVTSICEVLSIATQGAGSSDAWSSQQILDTMYNAVRSTTESDASSTVSNQITPSFITNWCVYQRLFMRLQQSVYTEGEDMSGGYNWLSGAADGPNGQGGLPQAKLPSNINGDVLAKPANDTQVISDTQKDYPKESFYVPDNYSDNFNMDDVINVGDAPSNPNAAIQNIVDNAENLDLSKDDLTASVPVSGNNEESLTNLLRSLLNQIEEEEPVVEDESV